MPDPTTTETTRPRQAKPEKAPAEETSQVSGAKTDAEKTVKQELPTKPEENSGKADAAPRTDALTADSMKPPATPSQETPEGDPELLACINAATPPCVIVLRNSNDEDRVEAITEGIEGVYATRVNHRQELRALWRKL